jgi:hypothetical protein
VFVFIGILPLIGAGINIIGGLIGAGQRSREASRQNQAIYKLIENQEQTYEITKQWRAAQNRQAAFDHQANLDLFRLQTKQQIYQQNLADSAATIDYYSKHLQTDYAIHQANQQRILQDQQEQQLRQQGFQQAQQVTRQGQSVLGEINQGDAQIAQQRSQANLIAGAQGLTRSSMAQQQMFDLAGGNLQQARAGVTNETLAQADRIKQQTDENYTLNRRILDMQRQYATEVFHNQLQQEQLGLTAQASYNASNRQLLNQQNTLFRLGARANNLAERQRQRVVRDTDRIQHESTLAQLASGLQPTGMGGALFGALAQGLGAAAGMGLFSGIGGGGSSGLINTLPPTGAATQQAPLITWGQPLHTINTLPPTGLATQRAPLVTWGQPLSGGGRSMGGLTPFFNQYNLINTYPPGRSPGAYNQMQDVFRLPIG